MSDSRFEAAAREHLAGALRALDRDDAASASTEMVRALRYAFTIVREFSDSEPRRYAQAHAGVTFELAKLPPSLIRQAVRLLDRHAPGS